ncbi:tRNA dihydrouridine(20/20a) synthase DusA [Paludibacterium sp. THUN1379]|uniref:tRNA dihydrouridine(20/20a) synthase DusA n=1 Tax=Paludibacterium sp. THUN1379 TaxID=3112107 RepID=UPI0030D28595
MNPSPARPVLPPRRLSVAPMLDWTDRHYRYFARLITRNTWLYTEMVTTGALLHGDVARHLRFDEAEHPLALQLGGSEPAELAQCARLAEQWGYDEVNLNVGCPSERVQKGAFGACLMAEPQLVADCVKAMRDACGIDVTVKHRIGIDHVEDYGFVRDFVDIVSAAGCRTFIVHARNAILKGLSPKENREIPPLKYHYVHQLKQERPELEILINGGIQTLDEIDRQLLHVDGVMVGREAYHNPYLMSAWDTRYYGCDAAAPTRAEVVAALVPYAERMLAEGHKLRNLARHILGLFQGMPGARRWRRMLSDAACLEGADASLLLRALEEIGVSRTLSEAHEA